MASNNPKLNLPLPVQGIRPDLDDFHVPPDALRSTSYNWLLRDGKLVTRPGLNNWSIIDGVTAPPIPQLTAAAPTPTGIVSFLDSVGTRHLVYATTERWWKYDRTQNVWLDIANRAELLTGVTNIPTTFRIFNSGGITYLLGVNGVNRPRSWDTVTSTARIEDFGGASLTFARCIAVVADRVLLGNLSNNPSFVDVSAFQDHTTGWEATQTATLADTPGVIVSMDELGATQAAIYKTDSIYIVAGTTGLSPFRFDIHTTGIPGPASTGAVFPLSSRLHAVFTAQGEIYTFDGTVYSRHPSSDATRVLYAKYVPEEQQDPGNRLIHGYYNRRHNELWVFFEGTGLEVFGPRHAIVLNMLNGSVWLAHYDGAVSPRSITASHYGGLLTFDNFRTTAFHGHQAGRIFISEGSTDDGNPIPAWMETGLSDLGDPTRAKTVIETEHYFGSPVTTQTPNVNITYSEGGEAPTVSDTQTLTLTPTGSAPYVTGHRKDGERITTRFVGMQIEDPSATSTIEYRGSSVTIVPRGQR